jgi:hypothetical protein
VLFEDSREVFGIGFACVKFLVVPIEGQLERIEGLVLDMLYVEMFGSFLV